MCIRDSADPTNDPTSPLLGPDPRIDLVKRLVSVVDTTGDGQIGAGDTANYAFAVTNTGNVALAGVTVSDPLVTVSGGPVALAIGATDSTTFTAAYVLVQADIDRGYVENTATATGNADVYKRQGRDRPAGYHVGQRHFAGHRGFGQHHLHSQLCDHTGRCGPRLSGQLRHG